VLYSQPCKCPVCDWDVPAEIVRLRGSFDCPSCGKALKVHGIHELVMRLIAVALGFLLARRAGFESLLLFGFGLMISPFLVVPVWRLSTVIKRQVLVPASQGVTTLSLGGK